MTTAKEQLQQWFGFLQDFQIACEHINTDTYHEDLLKFANEKISAVLPTANEQNQFMISARDSTKLTIADSDLQASSSFEALLETVWNPLSLFVASFVRSCAPDPFPSMSFTDFVQQDLAKVFPGGIANADWNKVQKGFTASIPAACYTSTQQKAANSLLTTPKKTIQDLVSLVSKMG